MAYETQSRLEEILEKRRIILSPLDLPPIGSEGLENYNPTAFSITLYGMRNPVVMIDCDSKRVRAYPRKVVKRQLVENDNSKTILGEYNEVINAFRRHNYQIAFVESFSPRVII